MAGLSSDGRPCAVMSGPTGGDVVVDGPQLVHGDPVAFHDRAAAVDQPLGVAAARPAAWPTRRAGQAAGVSLRGKDVAQVQAYVTTRDLELLSELIQADRLRPQIDRRYRFADISAHTGVSDDRSHRPPPS
jgi:hypothetical protein